MGRTNRSEAATLPLCEAFPPTADWRTLSLFGVVTTPALAEQMVGAIFGGERVPHLRMIASESTLRASTLSQRFEERVEELVTADQLKIRVTVTIPPRTSSCATSGRYCSKSGQTAPTTAPRLMTMRRSSVRVYPQNDFATLS
jgi:hypothetical protein